MSAVKFFRVASRFNKLNNFKLSFCITNRSYSKLYGTNLPQTKCQPKLLQPYKKTNTYFHTTQSNKIPAYLAFFFKPLLRYSAVIFGKIVKRWYKKKSPEEKQKIVDWFKEKKFHFLGFFVLYISFIIAYYYTHLEYNPWVKRKQFIALNEEQQEKFSQMNYKDHLLKLQKSEDLDILSKTDPIYTRVLRVTANLIRANQDSPGFKNKKWTLTVTNSAVKNAYILPGGNIFVHFGILSHLQNDDQLAMILSHELAHELLKHSYEDISRGIVTNLIISIPMAVLWATFPDIMAGIFYIMHRSYEGLFFTLPYSRASEAEADYVGLLIAAKACFDIREAVVLWGTMRVLNNLNGNLEIHDLLPWLSTHPSHGDRETRLNQLLPKALERQCQAGCPPLPKGDPRKLFYKLSESEIYNRSVKNAKAQMKPTELVTNKVNSKDEQEK